MPLTSVPRSRFKAHAEQVLLAVIILVPLAAVVAAVPLLWDRWISYRDVVLMVVLYAITGHGVTVGFHRYLTHGAFKAKRALRVALAVAGSMAVEGPVIRWVADHRRHHAYSDTAGDPHSPWHYGDDGDADSHSLLKGMFHAHVGWLFDTEQTDQKRFAPDLLADRSLVIVHKLFGALTATSLILPAALGALWGWSWEAGLEAFFWAGLVRIAVLHHVTWSVNSICHTIGKRPFKTRDRSSNVWQMAFIGMGENWHNLHHAEPTSARHGVLRGQVDSSARIIQAFEKLGWATDVRWPDPARLARLKIPVPATAPL
ncbi:MAG TPA: acyl-CoA desaturase [Frankiaceae bacterium]|nr:acyl-CoA desaturase [Frankiaceae bacterium]